MALFLKKQILWIVLGALIAGLPAASLAAGKKAVPSFFNSKEIRSSNLKPFKKWTGALKRFGTEELVRKKGSCKATRLNKCHYANWMKFLKGISKKDKMTQVREVNRFMNRAKYITDKNNWGKKDYWETPVEFMAKFGDCEDYAIAKYMSLRYLGFKDEEIRVVAVKDMNLKVGHAIMVVLLKGKVYVLDNQIKKVVDAKTVRHYQPVFSIGTKHWWRHRV
jgi:predicted transglutaminase-like cysteine proteinase